MNAQSCHSQNGADSTAPARKATFSRMKTPPKTSVMSRPQPVSPSP